MGKQFLINQSSLEIKDSISGKNDYVLPLEEIWYDESELQLGAIRILLSGNSQLLRKSIDPILLEDSLDPDSIPFTEESFRLFARKYLYMTSVKGVSGQPLDVILQDPTTPLMIVPLSNIQYTTSLTAPLNIDSYEMTVDDPTGFDTLDFITIYNASFNRVLFTHPISVLGNVVTLKIPSDFDFPIGSSVTLGSINLNVDGSVTPQIFGTRNPTADDIPLKFDISKIVIKMLTASPVDLSKFGDIAGGILRGVLARRVDGITQNLFHWDNNGELKNLCYDLEPEIASGNQQDGLTAVFRFGGQGNLSSVIRIGQGEDFQIIIQDDLRTISRFRIYAEGSIVTD